MKYWAVTHRHTAYIEAETEAEAAEDCARQVRDNADAEECTAIEISDGEYERHWEMQEAAQPGVERRGVRSFAPQYGDVITSQRFLNNKP